MVYVPDLWSWYLQATQRQYSRYWYHGSSNTMIILHLHLACLFQKKNVRKMKLSTLHMHVHFGYLSGIIFANNIWQRWCSQENQRRQSYLFVLFKVFRSSSWPSLKNLEDHFRHFYPISVLQLQVTHSRTIKLFQFRKDDPLCWTPTCRQVRIDTILKLSLRHFIWA